MLEIIRQKFFNYQALYDSLISTNDVYLIEGNFWHDNYWGICIKKDCDKCKDVTLAKNMLGNILMIVREECKLKMSNKMKIII